MLMFLVTSITCFLPDSINHRKPTLQEYIRIEHEKLEAQTIELVTLKTMEKMNDELAEEKTEINAVQMPVTPTDNKENGDEDQPTTPIVKPVQEIEMVTIEADQTPSETN